MLLYFGTDAYLFSPDEGSCCVFSTRNNCCEFLAFYGVIFQSVIKSLNHCQPLSIFCRMNTTPRCFQSALFSLVVFYPAPTTWQSDLSNDSGLFLDIFLFLSCQHRALVVHLSQFLFSWFSAQFYFNFWKFCVPSGYS